MFDILVYTDSTERESLSGRSGFQFIAASAGATPTDEVTVRESLQHVVPNSMDAASWAQHPPTCIYRRIDERMYLSRGASTGATIGGRPGNQLTATVMTSDETDILPLSPPQLYSSRQWCFERPEGKEIEAWSPPLAIDDDFDIPSLHAMVADQPWARAALPSVLTMLEASLAESRVRLVIKGPEQRQVMRWVALLSKFLDSEAALDLQFRVYADEPLAADAHIVGAHPFLSPDLTVTNCPALGVNLLDLTTESCGQVAITEVARRHAQWFLSDDPFAALEAIEVSRRWAGMMPGEVAVAAAELVSAPTSARLVTAAQLDAAVHALSSLAAQRAADELEGYGEALLDTVSLARPDLGDYLPAIVKAMWACQEAGHLDFSQPLALAALEWAAEQPPAARAWVEEHVQSPVSTVLTWTDPESRNHAAQLLAEILAQTTDGDLANTFRLGAALSTGIETNAALTSIDRLAALWIRRPELGQQASGWLHGAEVAAATEGQLVGALTLGDPAVRTEFCAGRWDWMRPPGDAVDSGRPLSAWFGARFIERVDEAGRREIYQQIRHIVPVDAWRMFMGSAPGSDEIADWLVAYGNVDSTLVQYLDRIFIDPSRCPGWSEGGIDVIVELGSIPEQQLSPSLLKLVDETLAARDMFRKAIQNANLVPNPSLTELGHRFSRLGALQGEKVVDAILTCYDLQAALRLTDGFERQLHDRLAAELPERLGNGNLHALRNAVSLLGVQDPEWRTAAKKGLDAFWDDRATQPVRDRMLNVIDGYLDPNNRSRLSEYVSTQGRGRLARSMSRSARGFFGGKERS